MKNNNNYSLNNNAFTNTTVTNPSRKVSFEEYQERQLEDEKENGRLVPNHTANILKAMSAAPAPKVPRTSRVEPYITAASVEADHEAFTSARVLNQQNFQKAMQEAVIIKNSKFRDIYTDYSEIWFNLINILLSNFGNSSLPNNCELNTKKLMISSFAPSLNFKDVTINGTLKIVGPVFFIENVKPKSVIDLSEATIKSKKLRMTLMNASSKAIVKNNKAHISWNGATIVISRDLHNEFCQKKAAYNGDNVIPRYLSRI